MLYPLPSIVEGNAKLRAKRKASRSLCLAKAICMHVGPLVRELEVMIGDIDDGNNGAIERSKTKALY